MMMFMCLLCVAMLLLMPFRKAWGECLRRLTKASSTPELRVSYSTFKGESTAETHAWNALWELHMAVAQSWLGWSAKVSQNLLVRCACFASTIASHKNVFLTLRAEAVSRVAVAAQVCVGSLGWPRAAYRRRCGSAPQLSSGGRRGHSVDANVCVFALLHLRLSGACILVLLCCVLGVTPPACLCSCISQLRCFCCACCQACTL